MTAGVYRTRNRFAAKLKFGPQLKLRIFNIDRLGESGARLAASLQRMVWLIECGAWRIEDGDPLMFSTFREMLRGNQDYADSHVTEFHSPHLPE